MSAAPARGGKRLRPIPSQTTPPRAGAGRIFLYRARTARHNPDVAYLSVDKLQNMLASEVFGYAKDKKKASGRALGTLVEIVSYYTLCSWGLRDCIAIESRVPEFANPEITHNVEFSLHPIASSRSIALKPLHLPITSKKLLRAAGPPQAGWTTRDECLVSTSRVMRNAAMIAERDGGFLTTHLTDIDATGCTVAVNDLLDAPFAIFECKRVGVEEGMKRVHRPSRRRSRERTSPDRSPRSRSSGSAMARCKRCSMSATDIFALETTRHSCVKSSTGRTRICSVTSS